MAVLSKTVEIGLVMRTRPQRDSRRRKNGDLRDGVGPKLGSVGGAALKGFAIAATGFNQSLELFKKGAEVFRMFTDQLGNIEAKTMS